MMIHFVLVDRTNTTREAATGKKTGFEFTAQT
jgi:hypothetical protein